MHGDFSRGHQPDRKRGRAYRRVLLQMGRPLLDSDVAASVDALLGEVRTSTRGLGCDAGSPDLGFLVTPGRLLAVFAESTSGLRVAEGTPDVWIDYRHRYVDRFPAVYVHAAGGRLARVTLPALQRLRSGAGGRRVALWARVDRATTISVNGVAVNLAPVSPDAPARVAFDVPTSTLDPVEIELAAGDEVWLFALEEDGPATGDPVFWVAPGTYHVDGLVVDAQGGGSFPAHGFPAEAGFAWDGSPPSAPPLPGLLAPPGMAAGTRLVAYLDVHERHVTAVEDPGIREEALGPGDTCTRAQLLGQLKIATVHRSLPVDAIRRAFASIGPSGGELRVDVSAAAQTTDPCALPDVAGYSGADNRLYRIEVHHGGPLRQLRLKWSRDNGSELFGARRDENGDLVFPAGTTLAAGDLVEVLSNVVDLGDDALAMIDAGGFVPPRPAVGQLAQLAAVAAASSSDEVTFALVNPDDISLPVELDDRYGQDPEAGLKVRRWHGILDPLLIAGEGPVSPGPHPLEDGIAVLLTSTGLYRPGQYWQYEARVRQDNANGPWRPTPHGPERRYAPLALLEFQGADQPLELVAWLDERFAHLCDLTADDISFDGGRVGSPSETVQEALEELLDHTEPWPVIVEGGISWRNDRPLTYTQFQRGLRVLFSEEMHPVSATPDAFVVTLEVPDEAAGAGARRPVIVDGRVEAEGDQWTFVPADLDAVNIAQWVEQLGGALRCRVRLASDVILDRAGIRPLDGEAVGQLAEDGYDTFVDLRLPSGDGVRGGDFHSWFYLTAPPSRVAVEGIDPPERRQFPAGEGPAVILVKFTEAVRFASIDDTSLIVLRRHSDDPRGEGDEGDGWERIPGTIQPYPFENAPEVVTQVTFAPDDPGAFQPSGRAGGSWMFAVRVRGTGDRPVVDADDRAIDGARAASPSDFVSHFEVMADDR